MATGEPTFQSLTDFLRVACLRYGQGNTPQILTTEEGAPRHHNHEADQDTPASDPERPITPQLDAAWDMARSAFEAGQCMRGIVTGWNRGGLLVRWDELQGFVPASQLKDMPVFDGDTCRDEQLARWVGEVLDLKIIELDRTRNRLVFSERATMWGPKDGDTVLSEISPGQTREGIVSNLCDFGAFVDLGGVDGLIHISELSWGRVAHPRELLSIGDPIKVYVLGVDKPARRIALSLKRLRADPWTVVDEHYAVGQTIRATITNVVDFGAFARIEDGLEGLIHISELSTSPGTHPSTVVRVGDQVTVRVLRIDSASRRLGLSMRAPSADGHVPIATSGAAMEASWSPDAPSAY